MAEGVVTLSTDSFAAIASGIWLVDFWAEWCGPCRALDPILAELAEEVADARIGKVEIGTSPELAARFAVSSVPTLVILRDGEPVKRMVGALPKRQLLRALAEAAGNLPE